jgi:hypothetical protein
VILDLVFWNLFHAPDLHVLAGDPVLAPEHGEELLAGRRLVLGGEFLREPCGSGR